MEINKRGGSVASKAKEKINEVGMAATKVAETQREKIWRKIKE